MAVSSILAQMNNMYLKIPFAGKMFRSSVNKNNKALCFCINKGYFESSNLEVLYYLTEEIRSNKDNWVFLVGSIDKVKLRGGKFCYRQRVFFKNILNMCDLCKQHGVVIITTKDFKLSINNVLNCVDDLKYLEWYANVFDETIDVFLTNTCKIQLYNVLVSKKMITVMKNEIDDILSNKIAYLERAPFLASKYDIRQHTSSVFINKNNLDERMYSTTDLKNIDKYGFTEKMVEHDRKAGVFRHED